MHCTMSAPLEDRDLLAFLDGVAEPSVSTHLEGCSHCRSRLAELGRLQHALSERLYRVSCPAPGELGEYHLALLSADRSATVAEHLAACPHCSRELAELRSYLAEPAPAPEPGPLDQVRHQVKVWIAHLVGDALGGGQLPAPAFAPAFAAARGADHGPFLFQAGDVHLALEVIGDPARPDRSMLLGLVTGTDTSGWLAGLWQEGEPVATDPLDDFGNLVLTGLAPGTYDLILSSPEVEVHVQHLEVRPGHHP